MKKLHSIKLILFLLISIMILNACNSQTPLTPTIVPTQSPIPSETPQPTKTLLPTAKAIEAVDVNYLKTTENIFPLAENGGTYIFECIADFDNIIYKHFKTPDGTTTKAWVFCEDGGQKFLTELFVENENMSYVLLANGVASKNGIIFENDDIAVEVRIQKILDILKVKGRTKIQILAGYNSGSILLYDDPFPAIFDTVDWDEAFAKFAQSGNPNDLPILPSFASKLIYSYRIKIIQ